MRVPILGSQRDDRQDPALRWIDFQLYWYGTFHGERMAAELKLTKNTLTEKRRRYAKRAAAAAGTTAKAFWNTDLLRRGWFTATGDHRWVLNRPSSADFLLSVARLHGLLSPSLDTPEDAPPPFLPAADALPELGRRAIAPEILRAVVRAMVPDPDDPPHRITNDQIGEKVWDDGERRWQRLDLIYRGGDGERRVFATPHALTHDTFRWAARARITPHDGGATRYGDLVLDRIVAIHGVAGDYDDPRPADTEWQPVNIALVPREGLEEADRARIVAQYQMRPLPDGRDGVVQPIRRSFIPYFLKRLQLETDLVAIREPVCLKPSDHFRAFDIPGRRPNQQPLALADPAAVRALVPRGMRIPPEE